MEILRKAQTAAHLYTADSILYSTLIREVILQVRKLFIFSLRLVFYYDYFILSSVCILPLVCSLQSAVRSLRLTLTACQPHFTQRSTSSSPLGCYATLRHLIFFGGDSTPFTKRSQHFATKSTFHRKFNISPQRQVKRFQPFYYRVDF